MTIPTASNFPESFDDDTNLFHVRDALRMTLAEDYTPGDTSIVVTGDDGMMDKFPTTGIITLTDQCADIDKRAISFFYGSHTTYSFDQLELIPGFEDVTKPKNFTHVTLNVVAPHHNHLKDALIAIEEFVGIKGTIDTEPMGPTLEGRINFLRKLVFTPRAWFKVVGSTVGLTPLSVTFEDQSFHLGPGTVLYLWDFGDSTYSVISTISVFSCIGISNCATVAKTYTRPGKYDVTLTVSNIYGEDTVIFKELVNPRIEAPDEAVIDFVPTTSQTVTPGEPTGGPFTVPPTIRTPVETFVNIEILSGVNPSTGRTYSGEEVDGTGTPLDPVMVYTWSLGDDLTHANQPNTRALYSVGGLYDLKLRCDTDFGAYRITNYKNSIDVVESKNLWLWTFEGLPHPPGEETILDYLKVSGSVSANEFGLISETFKTGSSTLLVSRDDEFLESSQWAALEESTRLQAKKEFRRNVAFTPRGTTTSGDKGTCLLYYASGGAKESSLASQAIRVVEYNGFTGYYNLGHASISRPWNWTCLGSLEKSYFIMGQGLTAIPMTNPSYQIKTTYSLSDLTSSDTTLTMDNYKNGAHELMQHVSIYNETSGLPLNGWFAVYRSTWKNNTGYFLRNDGVGTFFRIKSFYKTEGSVIEDFVNIKKLPDMEGPTKVEGQLVPMTSGVFFFNNSGNISAYNDTTGVWETGGPSVDSLAYHSIQDTTVTGFASGWNTLLAASNNDYTTYLSFDYSNNTFIKFNGQDLTFSVGRTRPIGSQFAMGIY